MQRRSTRKVDPARSSGIDGLRGLAAASVVLFHLWLYARVSPPATSAHGLANLLWSDLRWGLILFFVLSGFLLYRPWLVAAERGTTPDVWRYVRTRAARILPAYYLALAGSVLLLWGAGSVPGVRLPVDEGVALFLVFGQNFSSGSLLTLDPPMWTLTVEVSFYLLLPILGLALIRLPRARGLVLPVGLLLFGLAWSWVVSIAGGPLVLTKVLPAMLPFFAIGMIASTLAQRMAITSRGHRILTASAGVALASQFAGGYLLSPSVLALAHDLPVAIAFAALVVIASSSRCPRALQWRPVVGLGTISYGLYLWHVPVIWWLRARGLLPLDPIAALPAVLVPSLALALASWLLVERPIITWARRAEGLGRKRLVTA